MENFALNYHCIKIKIKRNSNNKRKCKQLDLFILFYFISLKIFFVLILSVHSAGCVPSVVILSGKHMDLEMDPTKVTSLLLGLKKKKKCNRTVWILARCLIITWYIVRHVSNMLLLFGS